MTDIIRSEWQHAALNRPELTGNGFGQIGKTGNLVDPTPYAATYGKGFGPLYKFPNGTWGPAWNTLNSHISGVIRGSNPSPSARNKAWEDFVKSVRTGPASLGVSVAEMNQSLGMMTSRLSQLYRCYRELRHLRFRRFLQELGVKPKRRHRNKVTNRVNEVSSLWLEYSFGWKPLFQDIHDGYKALGQPVPGGQCEGVGRSWYTYEYPAYRIKESCSIRCKQGAWVTVSNPNLYAVQQLGFANPALIAWELVPFSFVVDWVFDVGTAIGGLTDLLGCSVSRGYTTYSCRNGSQSVSTVLPNGITVKNEGRISCIQRKVGLSKPLPNFSLRANIGSSLTRAANAAALLGQIMAH